MDSTGKPAGALFAFTHFNSAKILHVDLEAARVRWIGEADTDEERERSAFLCAIDHGGRRADFHALRHTYISRIVAGGASVKEAQTLARHSDPRLTFGVYAHARLHDLAGARWTPCPVKRRRRPPASR